MANAVLYGKTCSQLGLEYNTIVRNDCEKHNNRSSQNFLSKITENLIRGESIEIHIELCSTCCVFILEFSEMLPVINLISHRSVKAQMINNNFGVVEGNVIHLEA